MSRITINSQTLRALLENTIYATASDDSRPVLAGVHLRLGGDPWGTTLHCEATDGFRMAIASAPCEFDYAKDEPEKAIVPRGACKDIVKQIGAKRDEDLALVIAGREREAEEYNPTTKRMEKTGEMETVYDQLHVKRAATGEMLLTSRLIDGNFPEVAQLVPKQHTTEIGVRREEFLAAAKRCDVFAKQNNDVLRLDIRDSEQAGDPLLKLTANASEVGSAMEHIESGVLSGDGGKIAFNNRYVTDILSGKYDGVIFRMQGPNNAGVFITQGAGVDVTCVIMPMFLAQ